MITQSSFTPPPWLRSPHVQTILPLLFRQTNVPAYQLQRLELPDGDFVDVFWCRPENSPELPEQPIVIVAHGMGGCFESHYVPGVIRALQDQNYRVAFLHARGCSGEPNRLPVTFHAADTSELHHLINHIKARYPAAPLAAVGFSLGGSVLLKWLAETRHQPLLKAAIAISVPFELAATADALNRGFARIYQTYLVNNLKSLAIKKSRSHPAPLSVPQIRAIRSLREYDDRMTAKINGFGDVATYYRIASCRQYLLRINTPTLIINAKDDPFVPRNSLPDEHELSADVTLELSEHGGHVGFLQSGLQNNRFYNTRATQFLGNHLEHTENSGNR